MFSTKVIQTGQSTLWLLVCDVDNTLLGYDEALSRFAERISAIRDQVIIAYSSGRPCGSIKKALSKVALTPIPDYLIGGLGTEIDHNLSGQQIEGFNAIIAKEWDRKKITEIIKTMKTEAQEDEYQTPYKVSYYIKDEHEYWEVARRLVAANVKAKVIYSAGKYLDIIPLTAGKGYAVEYLRKKCDIAQDKVIVAGDSENDLEMFVAPHKGIVVANATDKLKRLSNLQKVFAQIR